jgi:ankyrin repeat protein
MAVRCGHVAAVVLLCTAGGADFEAVAPLQDATPLALATSFDRCEAMQALLAAGASANRSNSRGFPPLHLASTAGAVQTLLSARADPNHAANMRRRTPLHTRAAAGCGESVKALFFSIFFRGGLLFLYPSLA